MTCLEHIPSPLLFMILQYIGSPFDWIRIVEVCKVWKNRFELHDPELWSLVSNNYHVTFVLLKSKFALRSKDSLFRTFIKSYIFRQRQLYEKMNHLIIASKQLLEKPQDCPSKLKKLINDYIPYPEDDFCINHRCPTLEMNSLLNLAARYSHNKCIKLLVETYGADVNTTDLGGFSPLMYAAYHGNIEAVRYFLRHGADITKKGKVRSELSILSEHWAIIQGNVDIFDLLRKLTKEKSNTEIYCVCGQGFEGKMIACDSPNCRIEWFHYQCVGLNDLKEEEPQGYWCCPRCSGSQFKIPLDRKSNQAQIMITNNSKRRKLALTEGS